jgi:hypothetical protein
MFEQLPDLLATHKSQLELQSAAQSGTMNAHLATATDSMFAPVMARQIKYTPGQDKFTTQLNPDEESQFKLWKEQYAPHDSGADYDLRGAFRAGLTPDPETGHWADTFKKPNHPTFSDQSKYAQFGKPGHWEGDVYVPHPSKRYDPVYANYMGDVHQYLNQIRNGRTTKVQDPTNPRFSMQADTERQAVKLGLKNAIPYGPPAPFQPLSAGTVTPVAESMLDKMMTAVFNPIDTRQKAYASVGLNDRPLLEHVLGVSNTTSYAQSRPGELGLHGDEGGEADTMRHLLLSAELHRKHPLLAEPLLYGHEALGEIGNQTTDELKRDLSNNELGAGISKVAKNRAEDELLATQIVKSKRLQSPLR